MSRDEDFLKGEGVVKMRQSKGGREALGRLQKRHEIDLLQPRDPKFDRVYGKKVKRDKMRKEKREEEAKEYTHEFHTRKGYDEKRNRESGYRNIF